MLDEVEVQPFFLSYKEFLENLKQKKAQSAEKTRSERLLF